MSRVLVTGGAGTIGAAVVRRLLADPAYEVRVSDQRMAPQWMREGCEVHTGDLRLPEEARAATKGCSHVIHLAAIVGGIANFHRLPHTLTEVNNALYNAVIRAALDLDVERFVYVSSSMVFERAELYPTPEDYLPQCPVPVSAYGFSKLTGEVYCRAAHDEHGLPYTICRPFNAYGPGEVPDEEPGIAHAVPDLIRKVLGGSAAARDLRLGRADAHADPRRRHRRRARRGDELAVGAERGLQHLRLPRADGRGDRTPRVGGVRRRPREVRARSTCRASRSTSSGAGLRSRRPDGCSAGRRRSESRRGSPRPCAGCATARRPPERPARARGRTRSRSRRAIAVAL